MEAVVVLLFIWFLGVLGLDPELYRSLEVTNSPEDEEDYFLPGDLSPTFYNISLIPHLEGDFRFEGHVDITFKVINSTDKVILHELDLKVPKSAVRVVSKKSGRKVHVVSVKHDTDREFLILKLKGNLTEDKHYTVSMDYTGKLYNDMKGFYRSYYHIRDGKRRYLATTQFEPTFARRAFPCFDEPAMRAKFIVSISRPADMRAISNMPQDGDPFEDINAPDDRPRYWDRFHVTPLMPTYLLAFVVSDFEYVETPLGVTGDNTAAVQHRVYAQSPMLEQAEYALTVSPDVLDWLSRYTGTPYGMGSVQTTKKGKKRMSRSKMDQVAVPDFSAGAMENWGLVTYREALLLYEEGESGSFIKERILSVIAHEFAHQWFGNLVTPEAWAYLWLNEGFATFFASYCVSQLREDWRFMDQFVVSDVQEAMQNDDTVNSRAMIHQAAKPQSIWNLFDSISYAKAGSVIRMFQHMITPESFRKGIGKYLKSRRFSTGTPEHLFHHLENQFITDHPKRRTEFDVKKVAATWTTQSGFPVVHVERNYKSGAVTVRQEHFLRPRDANKQRQKKWWIPLTYTTEQRSDFENTSTRLWMSNNTTQMAVTDLRGVAPNQWVLFNVQVVGYYRVHYDLENWRLLIDYLNGPDFRRIHPTNRAQLINDIAILSKAGYLDRCKPFELLRYLKQEDDPVPWEAALNYLTSLQVHLRKHPDILYFELFVNRLVFRLYKRLGLKDKGRQEPHLDKKLRERVVTLMCVHRYNDCQHKALAMYKKFVAGNETVNPDVRHPIYCAGLRLGDHEDRRFFELYHSQVRNAGEVTVLLSVVGCSTDMEQINRYLRHMITEDSLTRIQDYHELFTSIAARHPDTALEFFIQNHEKMVNPFSRSNTFWSFLSSVVHYLNVTHVPKLEKFRDSVNDLEQREHVVTAIDMLKGEASWLNKQGRDVFEWLEAEVKGLPGHRRCVSRVATGRQAIRGDGVTPLPTLLTLMSVGVVAVSTGHASVWL